MRKTVNFTLAAVALMLISGTAPAAQLKDDVEVFNRLLSTAIANEIQEKCESIDARMIRAASFVLGIVNYAKKQGFSMDEINTYRNDPTQQARLRRDGYAYLDSHGVDRTAATGYCTLGTTEIANKSQIGRLIKSR